MGTLLHQILVGNISTLQTSLPPIWITKHVSYLNQITTNVRLKSWYHTIWTMPLDKNNQELISIILSWSTENNIFSSWCVSRSCIPSAPNMMVCNRIWYRHLVTYIWLGDLQTFISLCILPHHISLSWNHTWKSSNICSLWTNDDGPGGSDSIFH